MTIQKPEPVAYLHECRKKPELKELLFTRKNEQLKAKGYFPKPLHTESDMEAYAQARVDAALEEAAQQVEAIGNDHHASSYADVIRALKGKV